MGATVLAWLVGMGLVAWRYVKEDKSPPAPGDLLVASGAFAVCGIVGMADDKIGGLLAWGLDAAALLALLDGKNPIPGGLSGLDKQTSTASTRLASSKTSTTSTTGGS